jgi:hypothetical protein
MKKATFVRSLFTIALIVCCPLQTRADTIALSFTDSGNFFIPLVDQTRGWAFTLSSPVLVTELGLWDRDNDGLGKAHIVTIWTSTGTQEVQGTIPSGTGATLTNGFRYVSIAPFLLPAGNYTIGGFYSPGPDNIAFLASTIATASSVTYDGSRGEFGFAFPPGDVNTVSDSYLGPNFQFSAPTAVADSGSTWALLLLGVTAAFGLNLLLHRGSKA